MSRRIVAVIGAGTCDAATLGDAETVGALLARADCIVLTGGLGGVMEAASRGASEAGGLVIGVVPGADRGDANAWVDVPVATGRGDARNTIIANTADAFVAVGGAYGTLSEIAFALKRNKRVVSLGSWVPDEAVVVADTPAEAVALALGTSPS
jgi:uncharacterized protein (TIGR00725 family)